MKYSPSDLQKFGKEHFHSRILPLLTDISAEAVKNMTVFIEGSASYGFSDDLSDIDIDYFIHDVDTGTADTIRQIFSAETYWHKSVRVSYGFGGKFWKFDLLKNDDMINFWAESNPYALYNIQHAVSVWNPENFLEDFKRKTVFYPDDVFKKNVRGLWLTMCDSGSYNVIESLKRNKETEGMIYFHRALEAFLRLIYLLNRSYYPPTKWLTAGINKLENSFGISDVLVKIQKAPDLENKYELYKMVFARIEDFLKTGEIIEKECIENYSAVFQKPFTIFNTF